MFKKCGFRYLVESEQNHWKYRHAKIELNLPNQTDDTVKSHCTW